MLHTYDLVMMQSFLQSQKTMVVGSRRFKVNPKSIQAWVFCSIIELSIMATLIEGLIWIVIAFIVLMIVMNHMWTFSKAKVLSNNKKNDDLLSRENKTIRGFFNTLIPLLIGLFAYLFHQSL
jgi:hypothetical protein